MYRTREMSKVEIGRQVFTCPMPVVLIGTMVGDRANFMTVGWASRANHDPPMVMLGIHRSHLTPRGIVENGEFSLNVPSSGMMTEVDYCGLVSGEKVDKSTIFNTFRGRLERAPMIDDCPLTMECELRHVIDLPTNHVVIGEIVAAYADERCLVDGKLDPVALDPLLLTMPDNSYWRMGERMGRAWSEGRRHEG